MIHKRLDSSLKIFISSLIVLVFIITGCIGCQSSLETGSAIDEDVTQEIERISSTEAEVRARAAASLANMGVRATPAVPFLIGILDDSTKVYRGVSPAFPVGVSTSPGAEAAKALVEIGEPAVEHLIVALDDSNSRIRIAAAKVLRDITGQDFGEDGEK
jgi:HEAT repeat protein